MRYLRGKNASLMTAAQAGAAAGKSKRKAIRAAKAALRAIEKKESIRNERV